MLDRRFWFLTSVAIAAAATRLLPHPPNLTAIGALALFGGASFASRRAAFAVPLLAMAASDIVLYTAVYGWMGLAQKPYVYAGFTACVGIGLLLRRRRTVLTIAAGAVAAALVFFVLSNFGVWAHAALYPKTAGGLLTCYVAGLPYLQNMVVGNLLYSALLFGGLSLAERKGWVPSIEARPTAAA